MFSFDNLSVNKSGNLTIGGVDAVSLAEQYGTPLYVMDENEIRKVCRIYKSALEQYYGGHGLVTYAGKAFLCKEMCRIISDENMGIDVVSGGEIYTAVSAGVNPGILDFHGNNKLETEIMDALECGVGRVMVDNIYELENLNIIAKSMGKTVKVQLRIKPGVDPETHDYVKTGGVDSKFGIAVEEALKAVEYAVNAPNISLVGLHCHLGSQIFESAPYKVAARRMLTLMLEIKKKLGYTIKELNLGGGFGVRYTPDDEFVELRDFIRDIAEEITIFCAKNSLEKPFLMIEPGRSIVASSGITLYKIGVIKDIPGIKEYIIVDGGLPDNPRYALYKSKYSMTIANKAEKQKNRIYTVAGRCCESGDLLGEGIPLQEAEIGDILAVLGTGAYNYSMSSNYNRLLKPAIVMVKDGTSRLIVNRETYADIVKCDI